MIGPLRGIDHVIAGIDDLDADRIDLYLDDVLVAKNGGRYSGYQEADGQRVMKQARSRCAWR